MEKDIFMKGYEEYKKCLEHCDEGKFQYSEELLDLIRKIEETYEMPQQEIIGAYEEMVEKEKLVEDSIEDKASISKADLEAKLRKVMTDYLLEEGYDKEDIDEWLVIRIKDYENEYGDKGIKVEMANEFVPYYDLPEEVTKKLDEIVDPAYFEPYDSMLWEAYIWDKTLVDMAIKDESIPEEEYEQLVKTAKHKEILNMYDISPAAAELFEDVYNYLALPKDKEWVIAPEVLKEDASMEKLYDTLRSAVISEMKENENVFDTDHDKHYGEHKGTEEIMKIFNIKKHTTFDSGAYVYQFPADMTQEDMEALADYHLEYLGKVNENGFQPGDHLVKGKLTDLKRYCKEFLGYVMHPDYLYKENEIDLEDILDAKVEDEVELKTYSIYSDKDEGPSMEEINKILESLGLKIKDVKERGEASFLVSFDGKEEDMIKIAKELDLPYDNISEFEYKEEEIEDKSDSDKLMNLVKRCKEILRKGLVKEGYKDEGGDEIFFDAKLEVRHEKSGEKDIISLNGDLDWQGSDFEEDITSEIEEEITKEYPDAEFKWWNNSAGGYWKL